MQAKSKTYGMRRTLVHMTPLGSVNVADYIAAVGTKASEGGLPIQYIHYAPHGELIANQQTIGYDERFKFTGKERDWETGYDYFGARFLWSAIGHWLSVDPWTDKYPNVTPYLYCNGNPIWFIDPDGRDIYTFDSDGNFTGNIIKQDGEHMGRILLSEERYMDFSFNDQSDVKRICRPNTEEFYSFGGGMDNNSITHITFFSDKDTSVNE